MDRNRLTFRDGRVVELIAEETPPSGLPLLRLRHHVPSPGRLAGPHWHPVLTETFAVRNGRVRFRVDRDERTLGPDEQIRIEPRQVHEFWAQEPDVILDHAISPPGRHWEMFCTWADLDAAGRVNRHGVPRNPLDIARLWDLQDGYLAGIPAVLQRMVLRPLARLAARRRGAPSIAPYRDI